MTNLSLRACAVVAAMAAAGSAMASVIDPFSVGSTTTLATGNTVTAVSGGLFAYRQTNLNVSGGSPSVTVDVTSTSMSFSYGNGGGFNTYWADSDGDGATVSTRDLRSADPTQTLALNFAYSNFQAGTNLWVLLRSPSATNAVQGPYALWIFNPTTSSGNASLVLKNGAQYFDGISGAFDLSRVSAIMFSAWGDGAGTISDFSISYVPTPGAFAVLGLAGAMGTRRRR